MLQKRHRAKNPYTVERVKPEQITVTKDDRLTPTRQRDIKELVVFRIATRLNRAHIHLDDDSAQAIMTHQITTIAREWNAIADEAAMTPTDRKFLAGRQFLNPFCMEGLGDEHTTLKHTFDQALDNLTG